MKRMLVTVVMTEIEVTTVLAIERTMMTAVLIGAEATPAFQALTQSIRSITYDHVYTNSAQFMAGVEHRFREMGPIEFAELLPPIVRFAIDLRYNDLESEVSLLLSPLSSVRQI